MIGRTQLNKIEQQPEGERLEEQLPTAIESAQTASEVVADSEQTADVDQPLPETVEPANAESIEFAVTHHTTTSNGVELHYVVGGEGEPLLLWHGFLGTWFSWRKVIPALSQKYTVIVPDMRGYGDSEKPDKGYDAGTLVEDFRGIVRELGFKKVFIAAHDMGAPPALLYAGRYPSEVRSLAYLDEPVMTRENMRLIHDFSPEATKNGGLWWWNFGLVPEIPETLLYGREREFLMWFNNHYYYDPAKIEPEGVNEYLRTFAAPGGVAGAFGVYREIFETIRQTEKYSEGVERVETPVLGLGGEKSMGARTKQMLTSVASTVRGGVVPECGHFIPEERPDYLTEQLYDFFGRYK